MFLVALLIIAGRLSLVLEGWKYSTISIETALGAYSKRIFYKKILSKIQHEVAPNFWNVISQLRTIFYRIQLALTGIIRRPMKSLIIESSLP